MLWRLTYPCYFMAAHIGVRWQGPQRTIDWAKRGGHLLKRFQGMGRQPSQAELYRRAQLAYRFLPVQIQCMEQALVLWFLFNRYGYGAHLRIGVSVAPFLSHAWVHSGGEDYFPMPYMVDMKLVMDEPQWGVG